MVCPVPVAVGSIHPGDDSTGALDFWLKSGGSRKSVFSCKYSIFTTKNRFFRKAKNGGFRGVSRMPENADFPGTGRMGKFNMGSTSGRANLLIFAGRHAENDTKKGRINNFEMCHGFLL